MKRYNIVNFCVLLLTSLMSLNCWALGVTTYYHDDHLGSPVYASNDFGQVEWQQRYKPYGEKTNNSPSAQKNDIWYTGKPHDDDTGLTYMNARYYDPVVGRFMAIDPVGFVDANTMSFNRYLYVNNNPYKYNDPDGEFLNFVIGGAFAAVQNIAIQNIEIALGVRDSFSYGELAAETALGVVTSGASTVKNGGRLAVTAIQYTNKADDVGDVAKIASQSQKAENLSDKADFIVDSRGVAVRNNADGARADLESGGYPGIKTTETLENGTLHKNVPGIDGPMDVRIMDGQANGNAYKGPRVVTRRAGTNDPVNSDGSKIRGNLSKSERNAASHIHLNQPR